MKKMILIIAIFAMFLGTNVIAQIGADLSITCWDGVQLTGEVGSSFDSKTIVTNNMPAIETDYTLNITCGSNFASFNPTQLVQSTSSNVGGASQAIREHPTFFRFDQAGAGNCTATINYSGVMKSCNFPYNIGNVQPPLPTNNMFLFGVIGIAVVLLAGMYLLFGQKKA